MNRAHEIATNLAAMIPKDAKGIVMVAVPKKDGGYLVAALTNLPDDDAAGILFQAYERMKNGQFTAGTADADVDAARS
jgi:hypothetical protein